MKKIYFLIITGVLCLFFNLSSTSQVTVTNRTNVTPNLAATYTSLALAITALNSGTSITGPVTITLNAGNPQTTPAGGYAITAILTGASATNTVTFEGNGNTITAFTPQANGLLYDAIFKIIGSDYITIQNFIMQENAANTTTAAATNNMTEWGVALLHSSLTNGAQNNTIQGNSISLNRTYRNTFGIYSNGRHSATSVTATENITNVTGSNFGNRVYNNAINNVGYGVVFVGSSTAAFMDNGNDIGGTSAATGNTITNWGGNSTALSGYVSVTASSFCIQMNHQVSDNVSYNTINSATVTGATFVFGGVLKNFSAGQPSGTITSVISNNTITLSSSNLSGQMQGINSGNITPALSTATISITNNTLLNCSLSGVATSSSFFGIVNSSIVGILNITENVVRSTTSTATTGSFLGISNTGAVVSTINITNNQIGNSAGGAITFSATTTGGITGIQNSGGAATTTVNLNNNSVEGISAVSSVGQLQGITNTGNAGVAININNNALGSATANFANYSGVHSGTLFGFFNNGGAAASTAISISNNNIQGIVYAATAPNQHQYISSNFAGAIQNINGNTFTNLSVNTTGSIIFINKSGNMTATGVENCSNNSIVTAFNKTAAGGTVVFYFSLASAVNGSTMTQTGNNFSNVTITGATTLSGWVNADGASTVSAPTKTITSNTFSNINGGSGFINVMEIDFSGNNSSVSSNTISNITGNGQVAGILHGSSNNQGTHALSLNTISNLISTGTGGLVIGISAGATTVPTLNVNTNTITGLSTTGASAAVIGLQIVTGATVNANSNIINTITGTGTTDPIAAGITVAAGTTVNVGYNNIHTINQNSIITTATGPVIIGLLFTGGVNVTAHNNFVANLNAANTAYQDAIRGISVNSTTLLSTYNLYYNSVHVNTPSNLATSGTSGIYHTTNATATTAALNMIDNIIVNTSASAGVGRTVAYRRSTATLNNFAASSNYNLLYAGIPSATNLIFYDGTNSDQTLGNYQTRVAARDANSISAFPNFVSSTDLHLTPANCAIDNRGTPIAGFTIDIDNQTRDGVMPDLGGDEFNASSGSLYNTVGITLTETRTLSGGATVVFKSPTCEHFAALQPNGASPVSGSVTARVYKYATVQTFFGEPYLQRVIDITPASGGATATGRVTLYYTQQEFNDFNTASGPWPDLPTGPGDASGRANFRFTKYGGTPTVTPPAPYQYAPVVTPLLINPDDNADIIWNAPDSRWEVTVDITGFSGFYVHTNNLFVLPITVNYLTGRKQGSNHLLNWKVTCNSTPRATMTLERSADSRNFTGINTITADAARCNQPFNYTDATPLKDMNYYRLKIVDADGKVTYSTTVALLNAVKGFDIISIAPNPVVGNYVNLNITSAIPVKTELQITDMQGRTVKRFTIPLAGGFNTIPLDVKNLVAGTYNISVIVAGENLKQIRFVKQ